MHFFSMRFNAKRRVTVTRGATRREHLEHRSATSAIRSGERKLAESKQLGVTETTDASFADDGSLNGSSSSHHRAKDTRDLHTIPHWTDAWDALQTPRNEKPALEYEKRENRATDDDECK